MPKQSITMTDEFWQAVEDYRQEQNIKTWSQALIDLAAKSLDKDVPLIGWGGARSGSGKKKNPSG